VFGPQMGPAAIVMLNVVDLAIGSFSAATSIYFLIGRRWAGRALRIGWVGIVSYEIGRALGMAALGSERFASSTEILTGVSLLALLVFAGLCVRERVT
jgi:hypothetical protein